MSCNHRTGILQHVKSSLLVRMSCKKHLYISTTMISILEHSCHIESRKGTWAPLPLQGLLVWNKQQTAMLPCIWSANPNLQWSKFAWPSMFPVILANSPNQTRHHGPQYLARYGHGIMEITSINMSFKDLLGRTSIISGTSGRSVKIDHEPCYSYASQEFVYISYLVIWS